MVHLYFNPERAKILREIKSNPGVSLTELGDNLQLPLSELIWHVRILEKSGALNTKIIKNRLVVFPSMIFTPMMDEARERKSFKTFKHS